MALPISPTPTLLSNTEKHATDGIRTHTLLLVSPRKDAEQAALTNELRRHYTLMCDVAIQCADNVKIW